MPADRHPLWKRLPPVPEASPEQLARVQEAVEERIRFARFRRLRWAPAVLLGLGVLGWLLAQRAPAPSQVVARVSAPMLEPQPELAAEPAVPEAPTVAPTQPTADPAARLASMRHVSHPTVARAARSVPVAEPAVAHPAPPQEGADDAEAKLLGQAIVRLRRAHDPQGALDVLANYRERFPNGALHGEAVLVQAESLTRLGQNSELVTMLNAEAVANLPRSNELQLLRAEALANLGRCGEAIVFFGHVLAPEEGDGLVAGRLRERALFGRALCWANRGQIAAARRDLALEEDEFPEQAEKVREALRRMGGEGP